MKNKNKITIQLTFNENTWMYTASVAPNKNMDLITFGYYWGNWTFYTYWIECRSEANVKVPGGFGEEFPIDYFTKLCQARYMIATGCMDFPEVELSKSAKKMLEKGFVEKKFADKYGKK